MFAYFTQNLRILSEKTNTNMKRINLKHLLIKLNKFTRQQRIFYDLLF